MKKWIIGGTLAALVALPALAQMDHGERHGMAGHKMRAPESRTDVQARVKEHFAMVDADKDGAITKAEADGFHDRMRSEMQDRMFATIDTDKNGQISRAEFDAHHKDMGMHHGKGRHGHGMKHGMKDEMGASRMFTRSDANGDGKVTLAEAEAAALSKFDAADANKDGTVTPEERRAAWKDRAKDKADAKN